MQRREKGHGYFSLQNVTSLGRSERRACVVCCFFISFLCMRVYVWVHMPMSICACRGKRTILGAFPQKRSTLVWRQCLQLAQSLQSWLIWLTNLDHSVSLSLFCLRNFKSLILVQHGFLTFGERDRSKVSHLNGRHIPDCRIYLVLLGSFYNVVPPPFSW